MESSDYWQIIALIVLLGLSAFFSASETALMSLSKMRIRHMIDENVKGANLIQHLIDDPNKLLGAILIGNNVVNISASALMTALAISYFGNTGVGIATGVMTILVLIFGEITPKSLAAQNAEQIALRVAKPIMLITILIAPLVTVMGAITGVFIRFLGGSTTGKVSLITEEELKTIVNVSHEEGILETSEKKMIHNVFEFGDSKAKDVMTQRTNMIAVDINASYQEVSNLFKKEHFTRIPVFEESPDYIIGIITLKDFVFNVPNPSEFTLFETMRQPFFSYEFKGTLELFSEMRLARTQIAIILDEYGGTAGIVTIEDLVEEIVGEIEDEYDEVQQDIRVIHDNEYVVEGSTRIEDVNEILGTHIVAEQFDSIGGYIIEIMGKLPESGDILVDNDITFKIELVDKNRIEKIRIHI